MTNGSRSPREWWLLAPDVNEKQEWEVVGKLPSNFVPCDFDVHVIEKSAFADMEKKAEELFDSWQNCLTKLAEARANNEKLQFYKTNADATVCKLLGEIAYLKEMQMLLIGNVPIGMLDLGQNKLWREQAEKLAVALGKIANSLFCITFSGSKKLLEWKYASEALSDFEAFKKEQK